VASTAVMEDLDVLEDRVRELDAGPPATRVEELLKLGPLVTRQPRPATPVDLRTQLRNVSGVHPTFPATEAIAAHCDSCSR